jgi:hypothetical protein
LPGGSKPQHAVFSDSTTKAAASGHLTRWLHANPSCTVEEAREMAGKIAVWMVGKVDAPKLLPDLDAQLDHRFAVQAQIYPNGRPRGTVGRRD